MTAKTQALPISRIAAGASDAALMLIAAIPICSTSMGYGVIWVIVFAAAYLFSARAFFSQTLGEALVGIKVMRTGGQSISPSIAAARAALSLFAPIALGLLISVSADALQIRIGTAASGIVQGSALAIISAYYAGNWIAIFLPSKMNIYDYCTDTHFIHASGLIGKSSDRWLVAVIVILFSVGAAFASLLVLAVGSIKWG